jgi:hypothetical protein
MTKIRISKIEKSSTFVLADRDTGNRVLAILTIAEMHDLVDEIDSWKEKEF